MQRLTHTKSVVTITYIIVVLYIIVEVLKKHNF